MCTSTPPSTTAGLSEQDTRPSRVDHGTFTNTFDDDQVTMSLSRPLALVSLAIAFLAPFAAQAQAAPDSDHPIQVTLFVKEDFSTPGLAAVGRRLPGVGGQNLIGFKRSALRPELILAAAKILRKSDLTHGARPSKRIDFRIPDNVALGRAEPDELAWAESVLAQLRSAPIKEIPPAGRVPAITITIPAR